MAPLIYLASPYSHINPAVRYYRYLAARLATTNLLRENLAVFSPIVYGKEMENIIGQDYLSWKNLNDVMLSRCDAVMVLKLDGWDESKGVAYEIDFARNLKKTIAWMEPPELNL